MNRANLVECSECEGYGYCEYAENRCTAARRYTCTDCQGTGTVWQLCDTDGCNHGDCEEAAKQAAQMDAAREREYDRSEAEALDKWRGA